MRSAVTATVRRLGSYNSTCVQYRQYTKPTEAYLAMLHNADCTIQDGIKPLE